MDKAEVAEERRSQILKAALRCFAHHGYHQTTMDDIVEESGLSKGTLYWYYESFEEYDSLISAIIQEGISKGEFRGANVHHLSSILVAAYDGLLFQWMLNPETFPWPETATTLIETFLRSMTNK